MSNLKLPDPEEQCQQLAAILRPILDRDTALIGIHSGGAWITERLQRQLGLTENVGFLDISFYRDDFAEKGLSAQIKPTDITFSLDDRQIILIDDVFYTGRTTRAAMTELFDYGRPAAIRLAVLADRGGRQLPILPDYCLWQVALQKKEQLVLMKKPDGQLVWSLENAQPAA